MQSRVDMDGKFLVLANLMFCFKVHFFFVHKNKKSLLNVSSAAY